MVAALELALSRTAIRSEAQGVIRGGMPVRLRDLQASYTYKLPKSYLQATS